MRLVLATILLPGAALAQGQFALPQGCEGYLTVQMTSCTVSHHFTCAADAPGLQRRVDLAEDGVTYFGAIDAETQWIESTHLRSGHSERLEASPADPASLTELLETGVDNYDFLTLSDEVGQTRYVGGDSLTGRQITIDGVTLDQTRYSIRAIGPDGNELWASEGFEYVSREWRMFLSGESVVTVTGETFETDDTPVEFIFPGEPGFLSSSPKHGCGATMSMLTDRLGPVPARLDLR